MIKIWVHEVRTRNTNSHSFEVFSIFILSVSTISILRQIFLFIVFYRRNIACLQTKKVFVGWVLFKHNEMTLTLALSISIQCIEFFRFDSKFRPIATEAWLYNGTTVFACGCECECMRVFQLVSHKSTMAFAFRVNKKIERHIYSPSTHTG